MASDLSFVVECLVAIFNRGNLVRPDNRRRYLKYGQCAFRDHLVE